MTDREVLVALGYTRTSAHVFAAPVTPPRTVAANTTPGRITPASGGAPLSKSTGALPPQPPAVTHQPGSTPR